MTPRARRAMALYACERGRSERRACMLCSTPRSALRYRSRRERKDRHLSNALKIVARRYPGWGYRLVWGYLRLRDWKVNAKQVYRLWRALGLALPPFKPSRKIKSGVKLKGSARKRNDVWAWGLVHDSCGNAEPFKCLTVKDEATAFCLSIHVERHIRAGDILDLLKGLIVKHGSQRPSAATTVKN